jgi:23S rRNA (adenine2030-N6)-methyltransferase
MNYRHAFHAGNHTEVFKHAALALALDHLKAKPQPFVVLDTHAGIGVYDLASPQAQKTREFETGAARIMGPGIEAAPAYVEVVRALNGEGLSTYPGSPEIIRRLLRDTDRLIACELHPEDFETLKARYRGDLKVTVHHRDGYEALRGLLPPSPRRGLVFIDPPFEDKDEADRLARGLAEGLRQWPTGIFLAWYPIKDERIGQHLCDAARSGPFPKALRAELTPFRRDGVTLAGGGLIVCNAPWRLDEKLAALAQELAPLLGDERAGWRVDVLT